MKDSPHRLGEWIHLDDAVLAVSVKDVSAVRTPLEVTDVGVVVLGDPDRLSAGGDIVEIDLSLSGSVTNERDVLAVRTPVGAALVRAGGLGDVPRDSLSDRHIEDLSAGCDGHSLAIWGKAERRAPHLADIHPLGTGIDKVGAEGDVDLLHGFRGRIQLVEVATFLEHNESAVRARELHVIVIEGCHLGRGFGLRVVNE